MSKIKSLEDDDCEVDRWRQTEAGLPRDTLLNARWGWDSQEELHYGVGDVMLVGVRVEAAEGS